MKLRSARLFAIGLVASTAVTALAGSGGFNNTGSMNAARVDHTATLLTNGEVLIAGGNNNTDGYLASAELYNPATGKWTVTGSMTVARDGHEAVLLQNGQVLVAGGYNPTACCGAPPLASAELYNPSTGTWTATGSMSTGRIDFTLTLLSNGEVLAAGGFNNGALSNAELYNPATGTWTATGNMTAGTISEAAVLLQNGEVFAASTNLYHPSTGAWTTTSSPTSGGSPPVVLLPNGDVFTGGNIQGDGLYNPSTNQWTSFPPPPCTKGGQSSQNCQSAGALLNTGRVLVAGGVTYVNAQPYPIEETNGLAALFDPSTLTWTTTGSMNKSRLGETMTPLLNGQVLVAGGETFDKHFGHLVPIASAELYTP
jgi:Galactose oxidase, central domain/Kelch motif